MSETKENICLNKPSPVRDIITAKFFDGASEEKLMLKYCEACGKYSLNGAGTCPNCLAKTDWKQASGRGILHTWSYANQIEHPAFAAEVPYLFGTIELEEGPLINSRLVDMEPEKLRIGMAMNARFTSNDGREFFPVFSPAY